MLRPLGPLPHQKNIFYRPQLKFTTPTPLPRPFMPGTVPGMVAMEIVQQAAINPGEKNNVPVDGLESIR